MKSAGRPTLVLVLIYAVFVACLAVSVPFLPERVATHFDGAGRPNGWMSRQAHLIFMAAFGTGLPLLMMGCTFLVRYFPPHLINIPNREYWLAPERRPLACAYLFRHSLWLGCLTVSFVLCLHLLVLDANTGGAQPRMSTPMVLSLAGGFIVGMVCWMVMMIRHFKRTEREPSPATTVSRT